MNGIRRLIVASALIFGVMCADDNTKDNNGSPNPSLTAEANGDQKPTENDSKTDPTKNANKKGVNSLHTAVAGIVAMLFIIAA
jgi:hypothetical protein